MKNSWIFKLLTFIWFVNFTSGIRRGYLGNPIYTGNAPLPEAKWFTQKLDHFRPTQYTSTWKQRYFVNDSFYKANGPAFLMIGGEGPVNPVWSLTGTWITYAKQLNAICFHLEHRFYGESHPTVDMSIKNLNYLTSEQALADLAYFVTSMNKEYDLMNSSWITFGGSYPGTLATWFSIKYSHLVRGSVSSSGPLVAKADFIEYLEVVDTVLQETDPYCSSSVKSGLNVIQTLMKHGKLNIISKYFNLCSPLNDNNQKDISTFYESILNPFEDIIQYNKDNREFEGIIRENVTINTLCSIMTNTSDSLVALSEVSKFYLRMIDQKCLDTSYKASLKPLKNNTWSADVGGRAWMYQTCTEFGWYQSSDQPGFPFTNQIPVTFLENQCKDIFGAKYNISLLNEGIRRTNMLYGGKKLQVSNIVFVHGSMDPWHALGITSSLSDKATAIYINGTAHCANMYPERSDDPPQLKDARNKIFDLIKTWI